MTMIQTYHGVKENSVAVVSYNNIGAVDGTDLMLDSYQVECNMRFGT